MKSKPEPNQIDEEASRWAARIEGGGMHANDHAAFSAWLNASPEHRSVFARYHELSTRLDAHIDALLGAAIESATQAEATARKRSRAFATALAAAAAIVVLALVLTNHTYEFATATAERHMSTLNDGSQVELNARTTLVVDFQRDERRVRLVTGEALFTVAKDAKRPFVVETSTGSVRVTGTVFDMRTNHVDRLEVTVLEGTVRVRPQGNSTDEQAVTAGSQAMLSHHQVTVRPLSEGDAQDALAWRQGQVVFNDTPLSEAIEQFAAYQTCAIVVEPQAADFRLGGRYSLEDLNGFLESIEGVLPVHVTHGPRGSVQITATPTAAKK